MMEIVLFVFDLLLPVIASAMDPSLLYAKKLRSLRLHDEFRLLDKSAQQMDDDSGIISSPAKRNDLVPTASNTNGQIRWQRSVDNLLFTESSNRENSLFTDQDALSSKSGAQRLLDLLLRSGDQVLEQARLPRQALHFQNFFREQCSSHLINAFLNMIPDRNRYDGFKIQGSLGHSADFYDLFAVIKYKPHLYHFINRKANRTVCVHPENGTLYSAPLEFYTHQDSHPCVFERVIAPSDRSWCVNQNGLTGSNIYLTTFGPRRALAMTNKAKSTEVITIPWSESGGPNGCSLPPRGCYAWREPTVYNCGVDGNDDCVIFSTAKVIQPRPNTDSSITSTTTASTSSSYHFKMLPKASRESRRCAISYCKSRAELRWRQNKYSMPPREIVNCVDDMVTKLRHLGDSFRNHLCSHQGFGATTTTPVENLVTNNTSSEVIVNLTTEKTLVPHIVSPDSAYSLPEKLAAIMFGGEGYREAR